MSIPLLSVCIQAYQHASYIGRCLDSVLRQRTNFSFEIILGEDDSVDGTREICMKYQAMYPELIRLFLRTETEKLYIDGDKTGRMNFISNLQAARGRYIALMDGDDYWIDDDKLEKQVRFLENNPSYNMCFTRHKVFKNGKERRIVYLLPHKRSFQAHEMPLVHTSTVVFRNPGFEFIPEHLMRVPFLDFPLYLHVCGSGKIFRMRKPTTVYRVHEKGFWNRLSRERQLLKAAYGHRILIKEYSGITREMLLNRLQGKLSSLLELYLENQDTEKFEGVIHEIMQNEELRNKKIFRKHLAAYK